MDMFCGKCGTRLDPVTGLCPDCDAHRIPTPPAPMPMPVAVKTPEERQAEKAQRKKDWETAKGLYKAAKKEAFDALPEAQKKSRRTVKALIITALILVAVIAVVFGLAAAGVFDNNNTTADAPASDDTTQTGTETETEPTADDTYNPPTWDMPAEYLPQQSDVASQLKQNGTITATVSAASGGSTEAQAVQNLTARGFGETSIVADFDMNGEYIGNVQADASGTDKHPSYTALYVTSNGNEWAVTEINGAVYATPITFNESLSTPVILSETATITEYDAHTNTFFVFKPKDTVLQVKTVAKIDAQTLETMTQREATKK